MLPTKLFANDVLNIFGAIMNQAIEQEEQIKKVSPSKAFNMMVLSCGQAGQYRVETTDYNKLWELQRHPDLTTPEKMAKAIQNTLNAYGRDLDVEMVKGPEMILCDEQEVLDRAMYGDVLIGFFKPIINQKLNPMANGFIKISNDLFKYTNDESNSREGVLSIIGVAPDRQLLVLSKKGALVSVSNYCRWCDFIMSISGIRSSGNNIRPCSNSVSQEGNTKSPSSAQNHLSEDSQNYLDKIRKEVN